MYRIRILSICLFLFSQGFSSEKNQAQKMHSCLKEMIQISAQKVQGDYKYFKILHCTGTDQNNSVFSCTFDYQLPSPLVIRKILEHPYQILLACYPSLDEEDLIEAKDYQAVDFSCEISQAKKMFDSLEKILKASAKAAHSQEFSYFKIIHCAAHSKETFAMSFNGLISSRFIKVHEDPFTILIACYESIPQDQQDVIDVKNYLKHL